MTVDSSEVMVKLEQQEKYRFIVDFGLPNAVPLLMDEDPPLGNNSGPDPSRLLAAATAHCLVSSLLFCFNKSRVGVEGLRATAKAQFGRNEEDRLRVNRINIEITARIPGKDNHNVERCVSIFEKYCTVSQSIQRGIPINLSVKIE